MRGGIGDGKEDGTIGEDTCRTAEACCDGEGIEKKAAWFY